MVVSTLVDGAVVTTTLIASEDNLPSQIQDLAGEGELELIGTAGRWLGVCGGPTSFFVAWTRDEGSEIWQAVSSDPPDASVEVVVGGQLTTLVPRYLLSLSVAREAAMRFLADESRYPGVVWDRM